MDTVADLLYEFWTRGLPLIGVFILVFFAGISFTYLVARITSYTAHRNVLTGHWIRLTEYLVWIVGILITMTASFYVIGVDFSSIVGYYGLISVAASVVLQVPLSNIAMGIVIQTVRRFEKHTHVMVRTSEGIVSGKILDMDLWHVVISGTTEGAKRGVFYIPNTVFGTQTVTVLGTVPQYDDAPRGNGSFSTPTYRSIPAVSEPSSSDGGTKDSVDMDLSELAMRALRNPSLASAMPRFSMPHSTMTIESLASKQPAYVHADDAQAENASLLEMEQGMTSEDVKKFG